MMYRWQDVIECAGCGKVRAGTSVVWKGYICQGCGCNLSALGPSRRYVAEWQSAWKWWNPFSWGNGQWKRRERNE